jgi:hypothetical protein
VYHQQTTNGIGPLVFPAVLLILDISAIVILSFLGFSISPIFWGLSTSIGVFLMFQVTQQIWIRRRIRRTNAQLTQANLLTQKGEFIEAILVWKQTLLSLPTDHYLDILNHIQQAYLALDMPEAAQKTLEIKAESLTIFEMIKDIKRLSMQQRYALNQRILALRKSIQELPENTIG